MFLITEKDMLCKYRVSQRVWNSLEMVPNDLRNIYENFIFTPTNCFFNIFYVLQNIKLLLKQFSLCSELFSKLQKHAMKSNFYFAVGEKMRKKQFFGVKINIF